MKFSLHDLCEIFTALGTVGAVIVALWQTRRREKLSMKADMSFLNISIYPGKKFIGISIVNTGQRNIVFKNIGSFYFNVKNSSYTSLICLSREFQHDGVIFPYQSGTILVCDVLLFVKNILENHPEDYPRFIDNMKIYYQSPLGENIKINASKDWKEKLKEYAKNELQNSR